MWALAAIVLPLLLTMLMVGLQQGKIGPETSVFDLLSVRAVAPLAFSFFLGAGFYLAWALRLQPWLATCASAITLFAASLAAAITLTTSWESFQILDEGHLGLSNMYEVSIFLLATTGYLGVWLERRYRQPALGLFLVPVLLACVLFVIWMLGIGQAGPRNLVPALKSYWLPFHVMANFVGYGAFTVAAAGGALQLVRWWQDKNQRPSFLPTQAEAEELAYRAVAVGFPVFTLAILLGSAWAYEAWGGYWSWDPKETWALIVWLVYGGYLHARLTHGWRGLRLAVWALVGFMATLFCYVGVNMFLSGLHSYGSLM